MNRFRDIEDKNIQIKLLAGLGIDYHKEFDHLKTSLSEDVDKRIELDPDMNVPDKEISVIDNHLSDISQNEKITIMAADLDELSLKEKIGDNETSDWKIGDGCWVQVVDQTWVNCKILYINCDLVYIEFACPPHRQYCGLNSLKKVIPITAISD